MTKLVPLLVCWIKCLRAEQSIHRGQAGRLETHECLENAVAIQGFVRQMPHILNNKLQPMKGFFLLPGGPFLTTLILLLLLLLLLLF